MELVEAEGDDGTYEVVQLMEAQTHQQHHDDDAPGSSHRGHAHAHAHAHRHRAEEAEEGEGEEEDDDEVQSPGKITKCREQLLTRKSRWWSPSRRG